ncbi:MAG: 50S ribosomal protein L11 methyltransferase [Oscillibacter sp.]|nr:50S ribosomal protein L11 methyltransferase [Oscillibacter sp.]
MRYLEVRIDTNHRGLDAVTAMLSSLGIDSVMVEDEEEFRDFLDQNRQYWDYVDQGLENEMKGRSRVTFYLPEDQEGFSALAAARIALQELRASRDDCGPLLMTLENVQDADWENNWKQYYKPMEVGQKLLIVPVWEAADLPSGRIPVILDPGLAFGTGSHETTRLCLTLLERSVQGGERVLDLGCGSGILSIAALKLGAASADAVDIDEAAVRVARENAALNGIDENTCRTYAGDVLKDASLRRKLGGGYQVVIANIVADVILGLAPIVPDLLAPGGQFLCSGIIDDREEEVQQGLEQKGWEIADTYSAGGWYAFRCLRREQNT